MPRDILSTLGALLLFVVRTLSDPAPTQAVRLARAYEDAKAAHLAAPADMPLAVRFAAACYDRAEAIASDKVRAALAEEGIAACRAVIAVFPADAPAHFYLGLNLGQLARTRTVGALKLVRRMEDAWRTARTLDQTYEHGGPDRALGILYAEVPRAPLSVGGRDKARRHLERALELAPEFPDNPLYLAEHLLRWGDREAARKVVAAFAGNLPAVRARFAGDAWSRSWADWDRRLAALNTRLEKP